MNVQTIVEIVRDKAVEIMEGRSGQSRECGSHTAALAERKGAQALRDFLFKQSMEVILAELAKIPNTEDKHFTLLQKWEGKVISVLPHSFIAVVDDKTTGGPGEVEIDIFDVPTTDRDLIKPGALFEWLIGHEDIPERPRQQASRIRFLRLPGWTPAEIKQAVKDAESFKPLFNNSPSD